MTQVPRSPPAGAQRPAPPPAPPAHNLTTKLVVERVALLSAELAEFFEPGDVKKWWFAKQPLLGGRVAFDMLFDAAAFAELQAVVARLRDGAFI